MSVKISKIEMEDGDSLFVGRGAELALFIRLEGTSILSRKLIIQTPMNNNAKVIEITTKGIEVKDS